MPLLTDRERPGKLRRLLGAAAAAFRPADDIEVDEWAEASVELSHRVSARGGPLRLEPYQRRPLQCIKHNVRVALVWATQTGKTIVIQCFMGWGIDQYPGPMMLVCPDQPFCKRRSTKHLRPFILDSPKLAAHVPAERHALQVYEYALDTMSVTVAWAGSPSQMAGEPIMLLGRDEFDKYADATATEANAFRLVERRTASFGPLRRILDATTPTVEEADGWKALTGGTWEEFYVPCPHCAKAPQSHDPETGERNPGWQVLAFDQFRYPKRAKVDDEPEELCDWQVRIRSETTFECRDCGAKITEAKRWGMIRRGDWHARQPDAPYPSFHLPSWYARTPVNSFGEVASRYVEGLEDPEAMRDWMNNDAALPYSDLGHNAREDLIRAHLSEDYVRGQIPTREPVIVIATADLHRLCHYITVWAFTAARSWLIDWYKVSTPEEIGEIRRTVTYKNPDGTEYGIEAVFPDAQYRTVDVYNLALEDDRVIPITGSARSGIVSWSSATHYPRSDRELDRPVDVLNVEDKHWKEQLLLRFESGVTEEGEFELDHSDWILPQDTPREFIRHMLGEIVSEQKNSHGYSVREWHKVGPNHYRDCAKYAVAVRYVLRDNLLSLRAPARQASTTQRVTGQKPPGWDEV